MNRKRYKKIREIIEWITTGLLLFIILFHNKSWAEWVFIIAILIIQLFYIINIKHTVLYARLKGGEKWRRLKALNQPVLFSMKVWNITILIVLTAIIVMIAIK